MRLDLRNPTSESLARSAEFYGQYGFLRLCGLEERVTPLFDEAVAGALGVDTADLGPILDSRHGPEHLAAEQLERMARVTPSEHMNRSLLETLEPLLLRTLGAFVHVSRDYHIQFKSGIAGVVDHGGFQTGHREVQGIHLLHQDFTGASIATSPSAVTLWVPLNDCDEWTLRLFPQQRDRGLIANEFLQFDDPRLAPLGRPLDILARRGEGVIFNAMMLHGSSNPGRSRRVSCDLRFFPLTAFLPSEVHALGDQPWERHLEGLTAATTDRLRAPFLEVGAFLGRGGGLDPELAPELDPELDPEGHSPLLWVQYLRRLLAGDLAGARQSFERFVNAGFGVDDVSAYERLFDGQRHTAAIKRLRARVPALALAT